MNTAIKTIDDGVTSTLGAGGTLDTASTTVVNTSGRKLKAAGKTIGTDFATSLTSGIASGDVAGSLSGIATSMAAFGGFAAVGLGFGAALITGMIQSAAEKRQAFIDSVNEGFRQLEVDAKDTGKEIAENILEGITFKDVLADLGGDAGELGGFQMIQSVSDDIGASQEALLELLRQGINPETQLTYELLAKQLNTMVKQRNEQGGFNDEQGKTFTTLEKIYDASRSQTDELKLQKDLGIAERDALRAGADAQERMTSSAADHAANAERSANAYERVESAILNVVGRKLPTSDWF
jgi:hypothetical protein